MHQGALMPRGSRVSLAEQQGSRPASSASASMGHPPSKYTREQSLRRVYSINQAEAPDSFSAWHVVSGAWGGRVGTALPNQENQPPVVLSRAQECAGTTNSSPIAGTWAADAVEAMSFSPSNSACASASASSSEIASWAKKVIDAPYFEPIPTALLSRVRDLLNQSNTDFSRDCGGMLSGWANLTTAQTPTNTQSENTQDVQSRASPSPPRWAVRPPDNWFDLPLGKRAAIGKDLLTSAGQRAHMAQDSSDAQPLCDPPDIWSSPFTVSFVSVGFRRLRNSLPGIIDLLEEHRPDILFLGDLGATRAHIGKLRCG